jgi:3'(2'), 5'-bisphosphate nucleotidase
MLSIFEAVALDAGRAILEIRGRGAHTHYKPDHSPVTEADEAAEAIILEALALHWPSIPAVAEEAVAAGKVPDISGGRFFLIDPLDGTREFINGRDDFTVNIALIENAVPTVGIVYAPALNVGYGGAENEASKLLIGPGFTIEDRQAIRARAMPPLPIACASRSHRTVETDDFLARYGNLETLSIGSSLKFGLLAEGAADIYPRFGRTMEWDTAAGDAVLRAAGGKTCDIDGQPLRYGKTGRPGEADFANGDFIATGASIQTM